MIKTTSFALALVSVVSLSLGCSSSSTTEPTDSGTTSKGDTGGGSSKGDTGGGSSKGDTGGGSGGNFSTTGCIQGTAADMDLSCSLAKIQDESKTEVETANTDCASGGGKVVTECPTANLVGCCTTVIEDPDTMEVCTYSGTAADGESQCKQMSGMWSTSL